jgi:hypothetical protein
VLHPTTSTSTLQAGWSPNHGDPHQKNGSREQGVACALQPACSVVYLLILLMAEAGGCRRFCCAGSRRYAIEPTASTRTSSARMPSGCQPSQSRLPPHHPLELHANTTIHSHVAPYHDGYRSSGQGVVAMLNLPATHWHLPNLMCPIQEAANTYRLGSRGGSPCWRLPTVAGQQLLHHATRHRHTIATKLARAPHPIPY